MKLNAFPISDAGLYKNPAITTNGYDERQKEFNGIQKQGECQTCANRKYVDGSNEMDVSFKAPAHISPEASISQVNAHEQMHVANARAEGSKENKELVSANVRIKMARCPECGVSYAAGGVTTTVIRTTTPNYDTKNPYAQRQKAIDGGRLTGSNMEKTI